MKTLVSLFARFGTLHYPNSLESYLKKLKKDFPSFFHHVYVIDSDSNSELPCFEVRKECFLSFHRSGNFVGEFSCWQMGSDSILTKYNPNTPVLIANSAFEAGFNSYLSFLNEDLFSGLNVPLFLIGHLEYLFENLSVSELENLEFWIRSSFMVSNVRTIRRLGKLVYTLDTPQLDYISGLSNEPNAKARDYLEYLKDWITGETGAHGVTWHSKIEMRLENFTDIHRKCNSILSEHKLSLNALQLGVLILDAAHWTSTRKLTTPWLLQLQNRPYGVEAYSRFIANLTNRRNQEL